MRSKDHSLEGVTEPEDGPDAQDGTGSRVRATDPREAQRVLDARMRA
jgi:hypothetical protein